MKAGPETVRFGTFRPLPDARWRKARPVRQMRESNAFDLPKNACISREKTLGFT
jgi:hypothetical protein